MRTIFKLIVITITIASAGVASAQSEEVQTAMQRLAPLTGTAQVSVVQHRPDGPVAMPATQSHGVFTLNGHGLRETLRFEQAPGDLITLETMFSYDANRDVYRIAVHDDDFGIMDIYEGRFTSDTVLIATNLRSDTYFPLDDGRHMHFQLRWDFSEEIVKFDVLYTTDGAATWHLFYEMEYSHPTP
ncbi:hypothetical protein [Parasphingopyxis lamellibrachiae]|uniref:DUF1579 domain-containing protein n=1 Tax=Parasphingopyxis lamellibrachiae TaxID=680125 RepID=A0A3D9FG69_9SPHN|nr:hypothetical protein [Parasphingopyxis lamellibrachiae]RED16814.1 hypothetical protein DFR46_1846 [Parasphingopyxis lamellibrachiae]